MARARSRIAALCHGARLGPGEQSGDDGSGFSWRTTVERAATEIIAPDTATNGPTAVATSVPLAGPVAPAGMEPPMRADLFAVRVTVSWPGIVRPHQIALETRCLSIGAADQP